MMTFEEWWEDRRPLSESISMKDMARFAWNAGTKCAPPEDERVKHLQMQLGYLATKLMIAGDKRTLPEIIEEAANATSHLPQSNEEKR